VLADALLNNEITSGQAALLTMRDGKIVAVAQEHATAVDQVQQTETGEK
jgi:hypothetical protein